MRLTKEFQVLNLIIFSSLIIYFNFTINFNFGDDVGASRDVLSLKRLWDFYLSWSGRLLAEVLKIVLTHNPDIFRVLNSIVMILMPVVTWILVDRKKQFNSLTLCVLLFLLYDYREMRTAGLITTYVTYYWSLFFNILFYIIVRRYLAGNRILSADFFLALLVGVFVCNSEICAVVNSIILFALFALGFYKNKIADKRILLLFLIPFFSLIFFVLCPGLSHRAVRETIRWLPDFSLYTTVYKLYLGFSETLIYYFGPRSLVLLFFLSALLVAAVNKGINVVYLMFFCLLGFVLPHYYKDLIIKFSNVAGIHGYEYLVILLCFCFLVLLTVYKIFKDKPDILILLATLLILGLLTRMIMGFSPTLYASSTRTYVFCDFALLISAYYLLEYSDTELGKSCPVFLALFAYPYFIGNLFP